MPRGGVITVMHPLRQAAEICNQFAVCARLLPPVTLTASHYSATRSHADENFRVNSLPQLQNVRIAKPPLRSRDVRQEPEARSRRAPWPPLQPLRACCPPRYRPHWANRAILRASSSGPVCAVPPPRASVTPPPFKMHAFPRHALTSNVLQMSSKSSSLSAGGGVAAAVPRTSGNSTPSPAGAPCPPQLSLEAISSFPPQLPPLDDSRMAPAVASSAAALRARFTTASSDAQALMLSMREVWEKWNLLPILPSGTRAACGLPGTQLPRCRAATT